MSKEIIESKESNLCSLILDIIKDDELKFLVLNFFNKYSINLLKGSNSVEYLKSLTGFILFINSLSSVKLNDLDWNYLCEIRNKPILCSTLLSYINNYSVYDKDTLISSYIESNESDISTFGFNQYISIYMEFYRFLCKIEIYNCDIKNYPQLLNIYTYYKSRKHPFEYNDKNEKSFLEYIWSDFPMNSHCAHMISSLCDNGRVQKYLNYNIRSDNKFIKAILSDFLDNDLIHYLKKNRSLYLVLYYFIESFNGKIPTSPKDFNKDTFNTQFKFMEELDNHEFADMKYKPTQILIYVYNFLKVKFSNENNIDIFPSVFYYALNIKNFAKYYTDGYEFLFFNPAEPTPIFDKVCIIPSDFTMNNSKISNTNIQSYNLKSYPEKYREDIKNFIWNSSTDIHTNIKDLTYIKKFLEIKNAYDKNNITPFYQNSFSDSEFDDDFLYFYRKVAEQEYASKNTLKSALKQIRRFLKFNTDKYNVTQIHFDILNLKKLDCSNGGTPMTDNDVDIIYSRFEQMQNISSIHRLQAIVFELFIHTNIRIGSILNFTRDCIKYRNDNSIELTYLQKTSNHEYVTQLIAPITANLIEEAIKITNPFINDCMDDKLNNFIFVHKYKSRTKLHLKRLDFYNYFKNIVKSESTNLDNDDYYPYNIRHTYMNNTFKNGIKIGLSINDISEVTGITYRTAKKYYRDANEIQLYVEALSKIRLSDVTIDGEILYDSGSQSESIAYKRPVKSNLGSCKSNSCMKKNDYNACECLQCSNFVTSTSRIPKFEDAIAQCDIEISNTENPLYIQYYRTQKELFAKYLYEMIKVKNSNGGK